jgi:hypothetical protein
MLGKSKDSPETESWDYETTGPRTIGDFAAKKLEERPGLNSSSATYTRSAPGSLRSLKAVTSEYIGLVKWLQEVLLLGGKGFHVNRDVYLIQTGCSSSGKSHAEVEKKFQDEGVI